MPNIWQTIASMFRREGSQAEAAQSTSTAAATASTETFAPRLGQTSLLTVGSSMSALQVATVYRCVNVLCGTFASLPLQYLKRTPSGIWVEQRGSISDALSIQPSLDYNAYDFKFTALQHILLKGNAYIIPVWSQVSLGDIDSLVLVNPDCVAYDDINGTYTVSDLSNGISGVYRENEIIHLKNITLDGKHGISVIAFARLALDVQATGDNETLNRFANGGNVRGIVGNDNTTRGFGEYADDQLEKTADDLDAKFGRGKKIVSLPGQVQFSPISMSSVDLEFLNSRKFGVREICRFFGVPPTFVFDDTSNNYKSAEMANVSFLTQTLNPILTKFELEFQRKLVAPHRYGKYKFSFDRKSLYATDLISQADYQTKTIQSGVYTVNEWRRYENKPEVPNGDRVLVSANLKGLDDLVSQGQNENESESNEEQQ